jgi:hypothetical protein
LGFEPRASGDDRRGTTAGEGMSDRRPVMEQKGNAPPQQVVFVAFLRRVAAIVGLATAKASPKPGYTLL